MSSWHLGMLAAFDTETTGKHPNSCRLVTACIAWVDGMGATAPRAREWLADPGVEIPDDVAAIHGITTEKARAEGRPLAEVVPEVADQLLDAAGMQVRGGLMASLTEARSRVLRAALRVLSSQLDDEHAHAGDEAEYANEQLALAARDLAEATEALPAGERPVGWSRKDGAQ